jgi:hydrogenase expression/formation protein HypC
MCVATPGQVVSIEKDTAVLDVNGNRIRVNIGLLDAKVGDWVLTHAGLGIEIMHPERARELAELLKDIEEAMYDGPDR